MKTPNTKKPVVRKVATARFPWSEIKYAIELAYENHGHEDDWNVPVIYKGQMLAIVRRTLARKLRLPTRKQPTT